MEHPDHPPLPDPALLPSSPTAVAAARCELRAASASLLARGLVAPAKWVGEQLRGMCVMRLCVACVCGVCARPRREGSARERIERHPPLHVSPPSSSPGLPPPANPPPPPARQEPDHPADAAAADALALAAALFAGREYRRAAHALRGAAGPRGVFLAAFSLYLAGEATRATARFERGAALGGSASATTATGPGGCGVAGLLAAGGGVAGGPPPTAAAAVDPGNPELAAVLARLEAAAEPPGPPSPAWDPFWLYLAGLVRADRGEAEGAAELLMASLRAFPLNWGAWTALAGLVGGGAIAGAGASPGGGGGDVASPVAAALADARLPAHWAVHVSWGLCEGKREEASHPSQPAPLSQHTPLSPPLQFYAAHLANESHDASNALAALQPLGAAFPTSEWVGSAAAVAHYFARNFDEAEVRKRGRERRGVFFFFFFSGEPLPSLRFSHFIRRCQPSPPRRREKGRAKRESAKQRRRNHHSLHSLMHPSTQPPPLPHRSYSRTPTTGTPTAWTMWTPTPTCCTSETTGPA